MCGWALSPFTTLPKHNVVHFYSGLRRWHTENGMGYASVAIPVAVTRLQLGFPMLSHSHTTTLFTLFLVCLVLILVTRVCSFFHSTWSSPAFNINWYTTGFFNQFLWKPLSTTEHVCFAARTWTAWPVPPAFNTNWYTTGAINSHKTTLPVPSWQSMSTLPCKQTSEPPRISFYILGCLEYGTYGYSKHKQGGWQWAQHWDQIWCPPIPPLLLPSCMDNKQTQDWQAHLYYNLPPSPHLENLNKWFILFSGY